MLPYALPCLSKFLQGTPYSSMLFSHALPCLSLGVTIETKGIRTIVETLLHLTHPYLVPKLGIEWRQNLLFILDFTDNSVILGKMIWSIS
jgi:hypothetical protein